jgi:hypothetical protein
VDIAFLLAVWLAGSPCFSCRVLTDSGRIQTPKMGGERRLIFFSRIHLTKQKV